MEIVIKSAKEGIITIDRLTEAELEALAEIRSKQWADVLEAEYGDPLAESLACLKKRREVWPEGQLVLYNSRPEGAIHGLRVNSYTEDFTEELFRDWHTLTGMGKYTTHRPDGNTLVCPEVYSAAKGGGKELVLAALRLARDGKGIKRAIVYTRPFVAQFLKDDGIDYQAYMEAVREKRHSDPLGMHLSLGAQFVRFVKGGRPADKKTAGYTAILEYKI